MSHTVSEATLSAAAEALLDAANTTVNEMAGWIVEAIADNHANNNSGVSVYADWQEWGGAAAAVSVYKDGPDADEDTDWAKALRSDEIRDAVTDAVNEKMADVIRAAVSRTVTDAEDLDALLKALKEADELAAEDRVNTGPVYDATDLPVFDGKDINEAGVFSWDETRKLVQGGEGWELEPRH